MSKRITTVAELDALPEGCVVLGQDYAGDLVARKPLAGDYRNAVESFWETTGSELGTDAAGLIAECGTLTVIYAVEQ